MTRIIDTLAEKYGYPSRIITDNGPEFTSRATCDARLVAGMRRRDRLHPPGKPIQNAHIESFNGRLRDEWLNLGWYRSIAELQRSSMTGDPTTTTEGPTARSAAYRRTGISSKNDRPTPQRKGEFRRLDDRRKEVPRTRCGDRTRFRDLVRAREIDCRAADGVLPDRPYPSAWIR